MIMFNLGIEGIEGTFDDMNQKIVYTIPNEAKA